MKTEHRRLGLLGLQARFDQIERMRRKRCHTPT